MTHRTSLKNANNSLISAKSNLIRKSETNNSERTKQKISAKINSSKGKFISPHPDNSSLHSPTINNSIHSTNNKSLSDTSFSCLSVNNCKLPRKTMEYFRTDLITNMKLQDSQCLDSNMYYHIQDQWRQSWERGVQVPFSTPVNNSSQSFSNSVKHNAYWPPPNYHPSGQRTKKNIMDTGNPLTASYSLDELDVCWLEAVNNSKDLLVQASSGAKKTNLITPEQLRLAIIALEHTSYHNMSYAIKTQQEFGIEYDDDVTCDVCGDPDAELDNELVFCDRCNVCVHQLCYGIPFLPDGPWLCAPCLKSIENPDSGSDSRLSTLCHLCPMPPRGAMKQSHCGKFWLHVSCARWIPELGHAFKSKNSPNLLTNKKLPGLTLDLSKVNSSRWNLICSLCKIKKGACIQCSEPQCVTAFHVSCTKNHKLETYQSRTGSLHAYCLRHSTQSENGDNSHTNNSTRLLEIETEFNKYSSSKDIRKELNMSPEVSNIIYHYWIMKKRSANCKPLVSETLLEIVKPDPDQLEDDQFRSSVSSYEDIISSIKIDSFPRQNRKRLAINDNIHEEMKPTRKSSKQLEMKLYQLRLDLEKARNLSYMLCRREKIKRQLVETSLRIVESKLKSYDDSFSYFDISSSEEYGERYTQNILYTDRETRHCTKKSNNSNNSYKHSHIKTNYLEFHRK